MILLDISSDYDSVCGLVANRIAELVHAKPDAVLGLATGSTPLGVYARLVEKHRQGDIDFWGVTCFNLDEYYPMAADSPHSYSAFMQQHLFQYVNCPRWFVPNGTPRTLEQIASQCRDYEALIAGAGGIDLHLLGIGRTGHIGFNEPGSPRDSRTRLVTLDLLTREDAAPSFGGLPLVPFQAVSMGIGTILEAREIAVLASGPAKAAIVAAAVQGEETEAVPASLLRIHPNATLYLDKSAAALLE